MGVKKTNKGKNIISFIIGILLMISIIISILSFSTRFIILNPNTYYKILYKKDIYNEIYNYIDNNISYALVSRSLSQDINKDIISVDEVENEVKSFVGNVINSLKTGKNDISKVNIDIYMERFDQRVEKFLEDNSVIINKEIKSEIELLKEDVKKVVESELQIINADTINNSEIFGKITRITSLFASKLYLVPVIGVVALILLLIIVWKTNYVSLLQWIGNSFISAGLMIFAVFFSGYLSKFYKYILINTQYLKNFVASTIQMYLETLSLWGACIAIIGVILIIPKVRQSIKNIVKE